MPNPESVGPASIAIGQSVGSFGMFLPRFSEVRRAAPDDGSMRKDVRLGEIGAATMAIGIGIIIGSLTGNRTPVMVSVVMSGIMIALYEQALRSE